MEALFYFWQQFFSQPAKKPQGQAHQPRQLPGCIGPELPQGPQQRRRRQQIQQHPRPGSQQQIQLRLAAAYPGQGPQGPQQAHQAEHRIGGVGQPRPPAAQHPQQIVYQAPGGSQGHGGPQSGQLTGHIILHPSPQPSSRVSQEPRGACCSS